MSLNCAEIRNLFTDKPKKIAYNHLEDYDYCRLLYENAKRRKSLENNKTNVSSEVAKFNDIHQFLLDMKVNGAFEEDYSSGESDCDYSDVYWTQGRNNHLEDILRLRRQNRVHSSDNSDYSFWSLDASAVSNRRTSNSFTNYNISMTEHSNYSELLRVQSKYFYVY